ncbi:hypothetical protein TcCL_NonESM06751 [Trypanosoma cruzi]|nr:hypothetical protein TcCL_NonESM06751 [Trypanosoma cruzi]
MASSLNGRLAPARWRGSSPSCWFHQCDYPLELLAFLSSWGLFLFVGWATVQRPATGAFLRAVKGRCRKLRNGLKRELEKDWGVDVTSCRHHENTAHARISHVSLSSQESVDREATRGLATAVGALTERIC